MFYKIIKGKEYLSSGKKIVGTLLVFKLNMMTLPGLVEIFKYSSEAFFELLFFKTAAFLRRK